MFQPYDPVAEIVRDMTRHILTDAPLKSRIYFDRVHNVRAELAGFFCEYLPQSECERLIGEEYAGQRMTPQLIELYAHWAVEHDEQMAPEPAYRYEPEYNDPTDARCRAYWDRMEDAA